MIYKAYGELHYKFSSRSYSIRLPAESHTSVRSSSELQLELRALSLEQVDDNVVDKSSAMRDVCRLSLKARSRNDQQVRTCSKALGRGDRGDWPQRWTGREEPGTTKC